MYIYCLVLFQQDYKSLESNSIFHINSVSSVLLISELNAKYMLNRNLFKKLNYCLLSKEKHHIIITSKVIQNSTLKKTRLNLLPKPSLTIKHV